MLFNDILRFKNNHGSRASGRGRDGDVELNLVKVFQHIVFHII